jgi:hypothetical protein
VLRTTLQYRLGGAPPVFESADLREGESEMGTEIQILGERRGRVLAAAMPSDTACRRMLSASPRSSVTGLPWRDYR